MEFLIWSSLFFFFQSELSNKIACVHWNVSSLETLRLLITWKIEKKKQHKRLLWVSVSPSVRSVLYKLCQILLREDKSVLLGDGASAFSVFTLVSMSACLLRKLAWSQTVAALSLSFHNWSGDDCLPWGLRRGNFFCLRSISMQ